MELDQELEDRLKYVVLKRLENGRPGWDVPHTLACVYWMKELLKTEEGNPRVLVPTMYLHDIYYPDKNYKFGPEKNKDLKREHMKKGALIAGDILRELGGFSNEEIDQITQLISVHDDVHRMRTTQSKDEQLVFEADSLGQIDRDRVKPTFSKEDSLKYLERFEDKRAQIFKTETGKAFLKDLLAKAKDYSERN